MAATERISVVVSESTAEALQSEAFSLGYSAEHLTGKIIRDHLIGVTARKEPDNDELWQQAAEQEIISE